MNHARPQYSIKAVKVLLDLSHAKVYEEINSGRLKSFTIGKRRFVSERAIYSYVSEREAESAAQGAK